MISNFKLVFVAGIAWMSITYMLNIPSEIGFLIGIAIGAILSEEE